MLGCYQQEACDCVLPLCVLINRQAARPSLCDTPQTLAQSLRSKAQAAHKHMNRHSPLPTPFTGFPLSVTGFAAQWHHTSQVGTFALRFILTCASKTWACVLSRIPIICLRMATLTKGGDPGICT